jgi:hypothetical protein
MTPSLQDRLQSGLLSTGCLLVLVGTGALVYLAVTSHWAYSLGVLGLIACWWLAVEMNARSLNRKELEALQDTLGAAFSGFGGDLPRLVSGGSHGFPTFKLIFASSSELKRAEESGSLAAFMQTIQSRYGHFGSKDNPFDANTAVLTTYEGHPWAH